MISPRALAVKGIARDIETTLLECECDLLGCLTRIEASCYQDKRNSPYIWSVTND